MKENISERIIDPPWQHLVQLGERKALYEGLTIEIESSIHTAIVQTITTIPSQAHGTDTYKTFLGDLQLQLNITASQLGEN